MAANEGEGSAEIVRLANCLKTESRVKMLLALKRGASRPLDVVKVSGENPSTLYRVVDEMIEAGVVERTEPAQGEVHWRLTPLGARLLASMEEVAAPGRATAPASSKGPAWIHFVVPVVVLVLSGVQSLREAMPSWILGGVLVAVASYLFTKRLVK